MKYKLIRKLKDCMIPVGSVSGELEYVLGIQIHRFTHTVPSRSCIPDNRAWEIPAWICSSMPHYFRKIKGKSSNTESRVAQTRGENNV